MKFSECDGVLSLQMFSEWGALRMSMEHSIINSNDDSDTILLFHNFSVLYLRTTAFKKSIQYEYHSIIS